MNRSYTITGLVICLLGLAFQQFNVEVSQDDLAAFVAVTIQIGGVLIAWYTRHKRGDITLLGKYKEDDKSDSNQ
jgi:hypothetical protein